MDLHGESPQYVITDPLNLHHLHHIVHMCEWRLRVLDASDMLNVYPQCPFDEGSLYADQWDPSPEQVAEYNGKKAFISEHRQKTVTKLNHALALLRRATHPDLLQDEIFESFDVDKAWELRKTPPPPITRQPGIFVPTTGEARLPDSAGFVAPPAPDKVELMNAHYAEQQSLLLAHPRAQPGPYAA